MGSWRDLNTPLDFLDLIWTTPFLWRRHCRWPGLSCWGWRVVGSPGGSTTGEGGGVGRLGEEGEVPVPGRPVATGMTRSLCGPCSGSLWSELGCVPPTCVPLLGRACHLCIQPLAVWDPDHYSIKPLSVNSHQSRGIPEHHGSVRKSKDCKRVVITHSRAILTGNFADLPSCYKQGES